MKIDVFTIFPEYLQPLKESLPGKAIAAGTVGVTVTNLREFTHDVHQSVDDAPYGGGPGMVMKPTVWGEALDTVDTTDDPVLIVPTPAGKPFTQQQAAALAHEKHLVFACGRYEGIDQRVIEDAARRMRVQEVSIGDYVLNGGEVAVLVMCEAIIRLLPGVLGNKRSHEEDSFSDGLLEGPSYTRPEKWRELTVPDVLLSGHHAKVSAWQRQQSLQRTFERRPELLDTAELTEADKTFLGTLGWHPGSSASASSD
ncbi:MAG: tRNA (guanosine(37)-N1)-methyltransferase TrmD [Lawsonella sp.]|nr:tRNA (guanosine(37)-N1)-methyltransferase TrmD [Mycobacteriales bacterium]